MRWRSTSCASRRTSSGSDVVAPAQQCQGAGSVHQVDRAARAGPELDVGGELLEAVVVRPARGAGQRDRVLAHAVVDVDLRERLLIGGQRSGDSTCSIWAAP